MVTIVFPEWLCWTILIMMGVDAVLSLALRITTFVLKRKLAALQASSNAG